MSREVRTVALTETGRLALRDAVVKRRAELGWTQAEVADLGGLSIDRLQAVESGSAGESLRRSTLDHLDRGLHWTQGSCAAVLEGDQPTPVESVTERNWSIVAAVKAVCRCGWSCAEHDDEKVATFCVRSHVAECSVGLGVESHDSAVRNHLLDVWGERP